MRLMIAAGLLLASVSWASDTPHCGDGMAVGSQHGDEGVHLRALRCGVPGRPGVALAFSEDSDEAKELDQRQRRIEHHLLKVQQERFEAKNRGEPENKLRRLDKEFQRTQQRWGDVRRERQKINE
jgi:hypothetical protein